MTVDKKPNRIDSQGIVHTYADVISDLTLNNKALMRCEIDNQGEGIYAIHFTWRAANTVSYFLVDDSTPTDAPVTCVDCLGR